MTGLAHGDPMRGPPQQDSIIDFISGNDGHTSGTCTGRECWNKKHEEVMGRVWKYPVTGKVSWKACRAPEHYVRLQVEDLGMNWLSVTLQQKRVWTI